MKAIKDFATKKEFFQYLVKHKKELIEFKRAAMKFTDPFKSDESKIPVVKSLSTSFKDDLATGIIKRSIIGNTYLFMDSHSDVHLKNVFARSISERPEKIWHLHDHEYKMTSKVGIPTSVYEKSVLWSDLGIDKPGSTMCLMMDSNISKELNPVIFSQYLNKEVDQHSVAMIYQHLDMAINDPEYKEEFAVYQKYIEDIGNKADVESQGYFWAIKEAILKEISCVLEGSNELTPTIQNEEKQKVVEVEVKPENDFYEKLAKHIS